MIVGWVTVTARGVRLWPSQRGRYFRDPASAKARETVVLRNNLARTYAAHRRDPYHLGRQHLNGLTVVRIGAENWPGVA